MKKWFLPLVVLALFATGAAAERVIGDVVDVDGQFMPIQTTHKICDGDSIYHGYGTQGHTWGAGSDSYDYIVPEGPPAWLCLEVPEEANAITLWLNFKERDTATSTATEASYTWGGWVPVYLGGEYREKALKCGLWESCAVHITGSAANFVDIYWRTEVYRD